MAKSISAAFRLVSQSVGGRLILWPSAVSGALALLDRTTITSGGSIPVSWVAIVSPLIVWLIGGLIIRGVALQIHLDLDPDPDISVREAFRHLMVDAKWSLGRKVEPSEIPIAGNSIGRLYQQVEEALRDAARLGKLEVWARPDQSGMRHGRVGTLHLIDPDRWDVMKFNLITCMGTDETATITDYSPPEWVELLDVRINKEQMLLLWPKASWLEKRRDRSHANRLVAYENEVRGTSYGNEQIPKSRQLAESEN